jgi:antitoxin VapB
MEFDGVNELEICKDGDAIILRPVKPDWISLKEEEKADANFLTDRPVVVEDEDRFLL